MTSAPGNRFLQACSTSMGKNGTFVPQKMRAGPSKRSRYGPVSSSMIRAEGWAVFVGMSRGKAITPARSAALPDTSV